MAGAALAAGIALWANVRWGRGLALFALGALAYSGINSLGCSGRRIFCASGEHREMIKVRGRSPLRFFSLALGLSWLFWLPAALSGQDVMAFPWTVSYTHLTLPTKA